MNSASMMVSGAIGPTAKDTETAMKTRKSVPMVLDVSSAEAKMINALGDTLAHYSPVTDAERFVLEAQVLSARLPERLRRSLVEFRRFSRVHGGLLIRGLDVGDVPATPKQASLGVGATLAAARSFGIISAALGDQYGFLPELGGRIIQDILPMRGFEETQQSVSSRVLLELHCETAFTDNRADFVGLLCLRSDEAGEAATLLASARQMLCQLSHETIEVLRQPRFITTVDESFLLGLSSDDPIFIGPMPVLSSDPQTSELRCDFAETQGLDLGAQNALRQLYDAAISVSTEIRLQGGQLLFIDNRAAMHGRTAFLRQESDRNRWLLRTFLTRDLNRSASDRPGDGRIVDRDYATGADVFARKT